MGTHREPFGSTRAMQDEGVLGLLGYLAPLDYSPLTYLLLGFLQSAC